MAIASLLSAVVMYRFVLGIPSVGAAMTSVGKSNWAIFWFNMDSPTELAMPVDKAMALVLNKYGIRDELSSNARVAYFYKRDPDIVSEMPRVTEKIQYAALALAKRVGMSDEDFDRFGHVKSFNIGGVWGFVAY
ncbi:MAG: hypothetical protein ACTSPE_12170 [Candidatus Thorarchaeota archaeon]